MQSGNNLPYLHSFAKVWLDKLGNKIYINGHDFFGMHLDYVKPKFEIKPLFTKLLVGEDLTDSDGKEEIKELSFHEMKEKCGLTIYRLNIAQFKIRPWYLNQRHMYIISKRKPGVSGELPEATYRSRGFKIEWLPEQMAVRGVGEGFGYISGAHSGRYGQGNITPWTLYEESKRGENLRKPKDIDNFSEATEDLISEWSGKERDIQEWVRIKEMPVMITEENLLLCLQKNRVLPKILAVGTTRSGKTFALVSLAGRIFYIYQDRIGLMNDALNQFYEIMRPVEEKELIYTLDRIGNGPRDLPALNLYMSCPQLKIKFADEQVGYRLVVGFKDFLYRYKYFTHGVGKWDLGKPEKYLTKELVAALDECKTAEQLKKRLFDLIPDSNDSKGAQAMIFKWYSAFENIFRDEFTSNLFKHEPMTSPYWTLKTKDGKVMTGHPFIIAMEAGLFPVLNNYMAKNYPIAEKQMADLMKKIVAWQMQKEEEERKRVWICVDELKDIDKKKADLFDALDYIFTQGAFNRIGFLGSIQEYTRLSQSMRNNTSHLIIFSLNSNEERAAVAKDYRIDKSVVDSLLEMKKHQCLFVTREKVVLYSPDGTRKEVEGGIWRGKILPGISMTKKP